MTTASWPSGWTAPEQSFGTTMSSSVPMSACTERSFGSGRGGVAGRFPSPLRHALEMAAVISGLLT